MYMFCRKSRSAILLSIVAVGGLFSAQGEISYWSASSGLRPDQTTPYWALNYTVPVTMPTVAGDVMTLTTGAKSSREFFTFGPGGILMPDALTIEFSARFVSSVADQNTFSPLSVYFCIGNGLGSAFYLGADDAWLAAPNLSRGVAATVDTDNALHTYRIELSGSTIGSTINVYYDNAASPLLTSTVVHDVAVYGNSPQIGFGDSSTKDSGVSEWGFLWHNASCIPINAVPEPTTAALLIAGALVLGRRSLRRN